MPAVRAVSAGGFPLVLGRSAARNRRRDGDFARVAAAAQPAAARRGECLIAPLAIYVLSALAIAPLLTRKPLVLHASQPQPTLQQHDKVGELRPCITPKHHDPCSKQCAVAVCLSRRRMQWHMSAVLECSCQAWRPPCCVTQGSACGQLLYHERLPSTHVRELSFWAPKTFCCWQLATATRRPAMQPLAALRLHLILVPSTLLWLSLHGVRTGCIRGAGAAAPAAGSVQPRRRLQHYPTEAA